MSDNNIRLKDPTTVVVQPNIVFSSDIIGWLDSKFSYQLPLLTGIILKIKSICCLNIERVYPESIFDISLTKFSSFFINTITFDFDASLAADSVIITGICDTHIFYITAISTTWKRLKIWSFVIGDFQIKIKNLKSQKWVPILSCEDFFLSFYLIDFFLIFVQNFVQFSS